MSLEGKKINLLLLTILRRTINYFCVDKNLLLDANKMCTTKIEFFFFFFSSIYFLVFLNSFDMLMLKLNLKKKTLF
jgi:hypothetical protein